jgi:hypothetical protein
MNCIFWGTNLYTYLFEDCGKFLADTADLRSKRLQPDGLCYLTPKYSTWTYRPRRALKRRYQPG